MEAGDHEQSSADTSPWVFFSALLLPLTSYFVKPLDSLCGGKDRQRRNSTGGCMSPLKIACSLEKKAMDSSLVSAFLLHTHHSGASSTPFGLLPCQGELGAELAQNAVPGGLCPSRLMELQMSPSLFQAAKLNLSQMQLRLRDCQRSHQKTVLETGSNVVP